MSDASLPVPLGAALRARSPRYGQPPTPAISTLIHGGILLLWLVLIGRAFVFDGVFSWSAGIAYVAYDTALLAFTFVATLAAAAPGRACPARAAADVGRDRGRP